MDAFIQFFRSRKYSCLLSFSLLFFTAFTNHVVAQCCTSNVIGDGRFECTLIVDEKFPDASTISTHNAQTMKPPHRTNSFVAWFAAAENGTMAPSPDHLGLKDNNWRDINSLETLAVNLIRFSVVEKNGMAVLSWTSQQDINLAYFEIESSRDGYSFETLARTPARDGRFDQTYSFINKTPDDWNIYRLKMLNQDGTFAYSDWVVLKLKSAVIKLYPNPVFLSEGKLTIDFQGTPVPNFLDIYSEVGEQLYSVNIQHTSGQKVSVDISRLTMGIYYVKIGDNLQKFVVLD